ncbi:glycoside hydrolase family 6 protein [Streptomyces sp. YC504]|uniref:Glycoside hydrolase family 6 protein n=1 Tax=Streptomyces mesophilus TaxID=1775132 RepID=A0A6G4XA47_9ACTN|nr:glycoside hydrolase family 6 protein [Streptomyces mesophilus]NGO74123.1 glycoside hydrolase family 6 protein [Streptomyces mesophilus]
MKLAPDALGDFECMTQAQIDERLGMLRYATEKFREKAPKTYAYLDGGNADWVAAGTTPDQLEAAGIRNVWGFAVNVSNYYTTSASASYAQNVAGGLGYDAKFVIDTTATATVRTARQAECKRNPSNSLHVYAAGAAALSPARVRMGRKHRARGRGGRHTCTSKTRCASAKAGSRRRSDVDDRRVVQSTPDGLCADFHLNIPLW